MDAIHKLELTLVEQYKKLPHLPEEGRKWLAENAWWLVLIGVIICVFGLFGILSFLALGMFGLALGGAALGAGYGAVAGATLGGVILVVVLVSMALYIAEIVLMAMAISPLKELKKRGWDLLFLVAVINAAAAVITNVLSVNVIGLVMSLLWIAVGAYFLFEVRERFLVKKVVAKPVKASSKA